MADIDSEMKAAAEYAIRLAKEKFGHELDYTDQSIAKLENLLEQAYQSFTDQSKEERTNVAISRIANIWGSYLGEFMRQKWGGTWMLKSSERLISINNIELSPIRFIYEKLSSHLPHSIVNYLLEAENKVSPKLVSDKNNIKFYCRKCGERLEVDPKAVGALIQCPSCHNEIEVPDFSDRVKQGNQFSVNEVNQQKPQTTTQNIPKQMNLRVKLAELEGSISLENRNLAKLEEILSDEKKKINGARFGMIGFYGIYFLLYTINGTFTGYSSMLDMPFFYYLIPYIPGFVIVIVGVVILTILGNRQKDIERQKTELIKTIDMLEKNRTSVKVELAKSIID